MTDGGRGDGGVAKAKQQLMRRPDAVVVCWREKGRVDLTNLVLLCDLGGCLHLVEEECGWLVGGQVVAVDDIDDVRR